MTSRGILCILGLLMCTQLSIADSLTADESTLARCTGVLPYAVNLSLMQNNIGAAKSLNLQSAKVTTAFFYLGSVDDVVPAWKMKWAHYLTDDLRNYFAKQPHLLAPETDQCIELANEVMDDAVRSNKKVLGEQFTDVMKKMAAEGASLLGL